MSAPLPSLVSPAPPSPHRGPRYQLRHRYVRVQPKGGYWLHACFDTVLRREVKAFTTHGPAMDLVSRLNAAWDAPVNSSPAPTGGEAA